MRMQHRNYVNERITQSDNKTEEKPARTLLHFAVYRINRDFVFVSLSPTGRLDVFRPSLLRKWLSSYDPPVIIMLRAMPQISHFSFRP